jgi:hypothetical protein
VSVWPAPFIEALGLFIEALGLFIEALGLSVEALGLFEMLDPLHAVTTSAAMATPAVSPTNLVFLVSMLSFLLASPPHSSIGPNGLSDPRLGDGFAD